jgi:DNA repair protein RadA/Sms
MAKAGSKAPLYRCTECGWSSAKWAGRCGECQSWGTVEEVGVAKGATKAQRSSTPAIPITSIDITQAQATSTGIGEFDRALGGGFVPGAVLLLAGEPGVGKSTLLLTVAAQWANQGNTVLYVTGEESAAQVRLRAERINALSDSLLLVAETDLGLSLGHIEESNPSLLIVDSIQTVQSSDIEGVSGGVTQVKEVASTLINVAKARNMTTVLVGHVTKDGTVAGPRALEHLVDVVLQFEGDRHGPLRLVRAIKNRYGPADEIGCFELSEDGIHGLPDPSGLFLGDRSKPAAGTCVTITMEGKRPLVAEVQALIAPTSSPQPRRVTSGLDSSRTAMMLGILERRANVKLSTADCFVATVGGMRLLEPATDLATALAIVSSVKDIPLPSGLVAIGEIGLAGDIRRVTALEKRLSEAARLGFTDAIIPSGNAIQVSGITTHPVSNIGEAIQAIGKATRSTSEQPPATF